MSKSSLVTENYPAYSGNYTKGRDGRKIEAITIHHMAGKLTAKQCGAIFQTVGRCGSSHYGIGYNGEIAQYVDEANTAWTNSNWDSNCKSVTIETANSSNGGDWPVNDVTLNSLIKLVADIAKRNNLGTLIKGKNVTWHSMFANTNCPGPYLLSKFDYIISETNKINGKTSTSTSTTSNSIKVGSKVKIGTMPGATKWIADDVQVKYGIYQIREDVNAGGTNAFDWKDNGIPETCVDLTDSKGNKRADSDRVHAKKGDYFVFAKTFTVVKTAVENSKTYLLLDFDNNSNHRFWVIKDYCKLV